MPDAQPRPWPACNKKSRRQSPQVQPGQTGIPCTMVLRLIRDLLGVPGLLASVAARASPARLDLSVGRPGPHDFAVRRKDRAPRDRSASITSRPNVRGDARTPLLAGQDARRKASDLPDGASGILVTGGVGR